MTPPSLRDPSPAKLGGKELSPRHGVGAAHHQAGGELGGGGGIDRIACDHDHRNLEGDARHRGGEVGYIRIWTNSPRTHGAGVLVLRALASVWESSTTKSKRRE